VVVGLNSGWVGAAKAGLVGVDGAVWLDRLYIYIGSWSIEGIQSQSNKNTFFLSFAFYLFNLPYFSNPNLYSSFVSMGIEGVLAGLPTLEQLSVCLP
jgi:hypothetical protein